MILRFSPIIGLILTAFVMHPVLADETPAEKPAIAVAIYGKSVPAADAWMMAERVRKLLAEGSAYRVVDGQTTRRAFNQKDAEWQAAAAPSSFGLENFRRLGEILKVKKFVVGNLTRSGTTYHLAGWLVNVEAGTEKPSADVKFPSITADQTDAVNEFVSSLVFEEAMQPSRPVAVPAGSHARLPPVLGVALRLASARGPELEGEVVATLICTISNTGKGAAEGIVIKVSHQPGGDWVSYPNERSVERLEPGKATSWEVPVTVSRKAKEGPASFTVIVTEANGFDADPAQLSCAVRAFEPPEFRLIRFAINDNPGGLIFGNGNGKVEPGETVEIALSLSNAGRGESRGTTLRVASRDPNVVVQQVNDRDGDNAILGDILSHATLSLRLNVLLNRRFVGGSRLPCDLELSDARPGLNQTIPISVPVLAAEKTTHVFDAGAGAVPVENANRPAPFVVAVLQLKEQEPLTASDAANITDELQAGLVNLGFYRIVERTLIRKVFQEQAVQQTGCTDQGCSVKLGKLLNAQRVVTGTTGKFGGNYIVSARVINVESGEIILQERAMAATVQGLLDEVGKMAERIGRNMR